MLGKNELTPAHRIKMLESSGTILPSVTGCLRTLPSFHHRQGLGDTRNHGQFLEDGLDMK